LCIFASACRGRDREEAQRRRGVVHRALDCGSHEETSGDLAAKHDWDGSELCIVGSRQQMILLNGIGSLGKVKVVRGGRMRGGWRWIGSSLFVSLS
jgi:hypothetical protein